MREPGPGVPAAAPDLAAAIGDLDRATRNFVSRFGEAPATEPAPRRVGAGGDAFEARLEVADREARAYLERAKARADDLVASMVAAVEREAVAIRRDAENGIRARWTQVEADAERHLEAARRVGEGMVAERQQRLAELSDAIATRAEALSAGLEDADRVRAQFDAFLRALSATAAMIARETSPPEAVSLTDEPRPGAIAA